MAGEKIPESWIGQTVAFIDKQDQEAMEGELLEVNEYGVTFAVSFEHEAEEDIPAYRQRTTNFYPWGTVRFMWVYEGDPEVLTDQGQG